MKSYLELGVNIDHVATIRQARRSRYPDPIDAALIAERAGADSITLHLREDRRHIQDRDVHVLKEILQVPLNLECALTEEMLEIALQVRPTSCCLVPERREEVTTEGGLNVIAHEKSVQQAVERLQASGIRVSLFIAPDSAQIAAARRCGSDMIELHTGQYAHATLEQHAAALQQLQSCASLAASLGLQVNAGHGLHYHNILPIAAIQELKELNIGHAIIARAVMTGMDESVREMRALMDKGRRL